MKHPLPLLEPRRAALETCGYCPKLCRAACPVSSAVPRDTLTPWGKMSLAWLSSRGDLPLEADVAATAWACTGCFGCRERCDHKNPVVDTLLDARADFRAAGFAPAASERVVARHAARRSENDDALRALASLPGVDPGASVALLIGCGYTRVARDVAAQAVAVARKLCGSLRLLSGCCGAPLRAAGDRQGAQAARRELLAAAGHAQKLVVVDPGCALELAEAQPTSLVDLAFGGLARFGSARSLARRGPVRYHDPCALGRGLGRYDEPRALLGRALGRAPDEFARSRQAATCSGGGALLPAVLPEASRGIAQARIAEHAELGGGTIVTACAASLRRLRVSGAEVIDLVSVLAEAAETDA